MSHDRYPGAIIRSVGDRTPRIHPDAWIAPNACIIGDVEIGEGASVWYNCVLRADHNRIVIGARSNIQDGTIIHVEGADMHPPNGFPALIGEDALVGHMAVLHGCTIEDGAFVGMGAVVMDQCRIGQRAMLAAGALLAPGKTMAAGELWTGRPATKRRDLGNGDFEAMAAGVQHYVENARFHRETAADRSPGDKENGPR